MATLIHDLTELQNMNLDLAGDYELANDIDASATQAVTRTLRDNNIVFVGPGGGGCSPWGLECWAQTFTAAGNYSINRIAVKFNRVGLWHGPYPSGTVTMSIRATAAGAPVGPDLTAGTIPTAVVDRYGGWNEVQVPDLALVMGTQYAIVIQSTAQSALLMDPGNPYPGGQVCRSIDGGATWVCAPWAGDDFLFQLHYSTGGTELTPIGDYATPFTGSFNSNDYIIDGLTLNRPCSGGAGLFGGVSGATISNLTITNFALTGCNVGGAIADALNSTISDCSISGAAALYDLSLYNGHWDAHILGALMGRAYNCIVNDCQANITIAEGYAAIGGLVGAAVLSQFSGCEASGSITVSLNGDRLGGLIGSAGFGGTNNVVLSRCNAAVDILVTSASYGIVGGLIGGHEVGGSASRCSATGNINAPIADNVGGLIGESNGGTVNQSCATGQVIAHDAVGGLIGAQNIGDIADSYASGAVTGNQFVGGLVGGSGANITNCYSIGLVAGALDVGGLVGIHPVGNTTNSFWDTDTSGQTTSAGGAGKTIAEMQQLVTFTDATWNIESHQTADMANGYPFLAWQVPGHSPAWFIFVAGVVPPPLPSVVTLPATEIR